MGDDNRLNTKLLSETVAIAVRFLDNVIDLATYPFPEFEASEKSLRRMGIGTMGLADALIVARLRYGSKEAEQFTSLVFRTIRDAAYDASVGLAKERGAFPLYDEEYTGRPFILGLRGATQLAISKHGIRNAFLTSQAPTGTTAKLAGVWAGIEPYFARTTILSNRLGEAKVVAPDSEFLVVAGELSPEQHIGMMSAAQTYIDSAVSKTVNAPNQQSIEEADRVYRLAYAEGLKSIAYYRDGSRGAQVQCAVTGDCD
jgi:ribonucleoside-diphosphate reductase alpha chain